MVTGQNLIKPAQFVPWLFRPVLISITHSPLTMFSVNSIESDMPKCFFNNISCIPVKKLSENPEHSLSQFRHESLHQICEVLVKSR